MIGRLTCLLLLGIHSARACVPVRPGEDMPCPSVPQAASATGYKTTALQGSTVNGAKVYKCAPPEVLLSVDGATVTELAAGATITCKPNSGMFVLADGSNVGSKKYACGTKLEPCQQCDMAKILDTTNAACPTQAMIFCKAKSMVTEDASKCPVLACSGTDMLYLLKSSTDNEVVDATTVMCDNGDWMYGANMALPAGAIGFVCGAPATCTSGCNAKVEAAYDATGPAFGGLIPTSPVKPTCEYKCPATASLTLNGVSHNSIVCGMDTQKVTVDSSTGAELAATDKFACTVCTCMNQDFTDGEDGLCETTNVCVLPASTEPCTAACPAGATLTYRDSTGAAKPGTTPFKCSGASWIEPGVSSVTCSHPKTMAFPTTPPDAQCPTLATSACPVGMTCDPGQLRYLKSGSGYRVMCAMGTLLSDRPTDGYATCENGMWMPGITEVNCRTDGNQADDCVMQFMDVSTQGNIGVVCEYGICHLVCLRAGQMFEYYVLDGTGAFVMKTNKYMKCYQGSPSPLDLTFTDPATVKCVT